MKQKRYHITRFLLVFVVIFAALSSCQEHKQVGLRSSEADSLINVAYKLRDYERIVSLADLHQQRFFSRGPRLELLQRSAL